MYSMSKEAAIQFLEAVERKPQLWEELRSQGLQKDQNPQSQKRLLDIAAKEGYQFTIDELTSAVKSRAEENMKTGELSEEDLEQVAGGALCLPFNTCYIASWLDRDRP
jgi:predicted ribosomally synthesized peptide with nif11-like leader